MTIDEIRALNGNYKIFSVTDPEFRAYGKVVEGLNFSSMVDFAEKNLEIPKDGNKYVASVKELEAFPVMKEVEYDIYGEMPIEAGFCTGQNTALTGYERHQGSEVNVAVTDCILILGKQQDMDGQTFDGAKSEIFYVPKNTAVELYATTLHYSPCKVCNDGFMVIVILLEGTNSAFAADHKPAGTNKLLTKKNKFLIVHPSQTAKIQAGTLPGLKGDMIDIKVK